MNNSIDIKDLNIGYQHTLVKGVSAQLVQGDFCVLFGANGVGKSTLIKTIRNKIPAISGICQVLGKNIEHYSLHELSRKVAVVTTERQMLSQLKVLDVIKFGRIPYLNLFGKFTDEDFVIVERYMDKFGITSLKEKKVNELSDGQIQKVMLCRALVQETPIILLDEPTVHLDVENKVMMFHLLKQLSEEEKKTIICTTHEIELGLKFANKLWMIDKEKLWQVGNTKDFSVESVQSHLFNLNFG